MAAMGLGPPSAPSAPPASQAPQPTFQRSQSGSSDQSSQPGGACCHCESGQSCLRMHWCNRMRLPAGCGVAHMIVTFTMSGISPQLHASSHKLQAWLKLCTQSLNPIRSIAGIAPHPSTQAPMHAFHMAFAWQPGSRSASACICNVGGPTMAKHDSFSSQPGFTGKVSGPLTAALKAGPSMPRLSRCFPLPRARADQSSQLSCPACARCDTHPALPTHDAAYSPTHGKQAMHL